MRVGFVVDEEKGWVLLGEWGLDVVAVELTLQILGVWMYAYSVLTSKLTSIKGVVRLEG